MKWPFWVATFLSSLSLILTVVFIFQTQGSQRLEKEIQQKQLAFAQAQQLEAARNNMLREMGAVAMKNEKLRELLLRHGYSVSYQNASQSQPTQTPPSSASPESGQGAASPESTVPKASPAEKTATP